MVRPWLRNSLIVAGLLSVAALAFFFRKGRAPQDAEVDQAAVAKMAEPASRKPAERSASPVQGAGAELARNEAAVDNATAAARPAPTAAPRPQPSAEMRQLVSSLCRSDTPPGAMTTEQVLQWTMKWHALVEQKGAAVPAILEFLEKNVDYQFSAEGNSAVGYASARGAMFDALLQIGGAEGANAMLQVLQQTADPREIALLAMSLEKLAPEQYRQEAVNAVAQTLAMAADNKLPGVDVAPLFQVLHTYGGAGAVPELEQAAKNWNYYATMGLAQLSDGAGIPALIQIAQGTTGARGNALEMLAQASPQFPEARTALLDLVRANKIGPNQWPYLTPMLAGDQYHYQDPLPTDWAPFVSRRSSGGSHVVFGNQHFYTAPDLGNLTQELVDQRAALINELRAATTDPAALKALEAARVLLENRFAKALTARSLPQ